jgi:hypothetical protein
VSSQDTPPSVLMKKSVVWPKIGGSVGVPVVQIPSRFWWNAPLNSPCEQKVSVASKVPSLLNANQAHSPPRPTTLVQNGWVLASQ